MREKIAWSPLAYISLLCNVIIIGLVHCLITSHFKVHVGWRDPLHVLLIFIFGTRGWSFMLILCFCDNWFGWTLAWGYLGVTSISPFNWVIKSDFWCTWLQFLLRRGSSQRFNTCLWNSITLHYWQRLFTELVYIVAGRYLSASTMEWVSTIVQQLIETSLETWWRINRQRWNRHSSFCIEWPTSNNSFFLRHFSQLFRNFRYRDQISSSGQSPRISGHSNWPTSISEQPCIQFNIIYLM